jgi:hypothetical protein
MTDAERELRARDVVACMRKTNLPTWDVALAIVDLASTWSAPASAVTMSDEDVGEALAMAFQGATGDDCVLWKHFTRTTQNGYLAEARRAREIFAAREGVPMPDRDALLSELWRSELPMSSKDSARQIVDWFLQRYGAPPSTPPDPTLPHDAEKLGRILHDVAWRSSPKPFVPDCAALGTYVIGLQSALKEENARLRGALKKAWHALIFPKYNTADLMAELTDIIGNPAATSTPTPQAAEAPGRDAREIVQLSVGVCECDQGQTTIGFMGALAKDGTAWWRYENGPEWQAIPPLPCRREREAG